MCSRSIHPHNLTKINEKGIIWKNIILGYKSGSPLLSPTPHAMAGVIKLIRKAKIILNFTESALLADSVYKSRCPCVCVSVCISVPSREVPFKCLFAPIYKGPR